VYGDDHVWNKSDDKDVSSWLSGHEFAYFMKMHFACEVRDLYDGIPFCTKQHNGIIVDKGVTFLQYQMVLNPYIHLPNQPWCLPFRETWAFVIRAVYGRSPRERDAHDVALSCIGHAYGTYASNSDAYLRLWCIFDRCCKYLQVNSHDILQTLKERVTHQDLADLRRKGITQEDLEQGFPSMATLIKKNEIDPTRAGRYNPQDAPYGPEEYYW